MKRKTMADRTFINKCAIRKKDFDKGGSLMNCAFNVEELASYAKDGWVRIVISERRSPSEKGHTHYAYLDTFVPKQKAEPVQEEEPDDIPF
jgi:hypothetical protein